MIASKFTNVRDNFKSYCDKAHGEEETIIITRKGDKNVVLISEDSYNKLIRKAKKAV